MNIIFQLKFRLGITFSGYELDDQRVFDRKHRIVIEVFAIFIEYLGCDGFVSLEENDQMNMRWSIRMTIQQLQQLSGRAIEGDWVGSGSQAVECIFAIRVRHEFASQVRVDLIWILLFIETIRRSLPDVDCSIG